MGNEQPIGYLLCKCGAAMIIVQVNTAQTSYTWRCDRCKRRLGMLWDESRVKPQHRGPRPDAA
ncbi:MAG: hypothetical protein U1B94_01400 [candidate division NC10 bacterium]|nr:hypothetical protein [candidate division NC10 bacterium]